jgi:predicted DNA-binding WGR domain protein
MELTIMTNKLEYIDNIRNSFKGYNVSIKENLNTNEYCVEAFYGRLGNTFTQHEIITTTDKQLAYKTFNKQLNSKLKKGYESKYKYYNGVYYQKKLELLKAKNIIPENHYKRLLQLAQTNDWANLQLIDNYLNQ